MAGDYQYHCPCCRCGATWYTPPYPPPFTDEVKALLERMIQSELAKMTASKGTYVLDSPTAVG